MKGSLVRVRVSALSICGDLFGEQADDSSAWRLRVYPVSTTSRDEALAEPFSDGDAPPVAGRHA